MDAVQRFCTFFLNGLWLGIDVELVQEVLRSQAVTSVPLAPDTVAGLINLRGQIVAAIDLRRSMGLPPRPAGQPAMNVVVTTRGGVISLLVDEVGEVVQAGHDSYEAAPESLSAESRRLVPGVYKLPEGLLHVLALDMVCGVENTKEEAVKVFKERQPAADEPSSGFPLGRRHVHA